MAKYYSRSKQKFIDIATMTDQYVRYALIQKCKHEPTEDVMFAQQQAERATRLEEEKISMGYKISEYKDRIISLENSIRKLNSQPTVTADAYNVAWKKIETLEKGLKEKTAELEFLKHHNKQDIETIKTKTYATIDLAKENKKLKLENARLVDRLERDDHGIGEIERQRDDYKKKANDMEMAKMNINREWLDAKDKLKDTVSKRAYQIMFDECQKIAKDLDKANDKIRHLERSLDNYIPKGDLKMFSEIPNDDEGREFVQKMKGYLNKESYKLRVKGQYLDEETKRTEGWKVHQYGQPISKSKCLRVYVDVRKGD